MHTNIAFKLKMCTLAFCIGKVLIYMFVVVNSIRALFHYVILYLCIGIIMFVFSLYIQKLELKLIYVSNRDNKKISQFLKMIAYIIAIVYFVVKVVYISFSMSYLQTGQLMGIESMLSLLWNGFIAYYVCYILLGTSKIAEYREKYGRIKMTA